MDKKYLFENEEIILQSNGNLITLTNLRLRYTATEWGKAHIVSMLLDKISSIEVHYHSKTIFAIIGIISIIVGLITGFNGGGSIAIMGIVIGIILFIIYFISRKHSLTISSYGDGKIHFRIKGMKQEKVLEFINEIENSTRKRQEKLK